MVLAGIKIIINNNTPLVDGLMVGPNSNNNILCYNIIIMVDRNANHNIIYINMIIIINFI